MGSYPMDAQVTLAPGRNLNGGGEWGSVCFCGNDSAWKVRNRALFTNCGWFCK